MHSNLARTLLNRGIIRQGTVIDSYQQARGLSCGPTDVVAPLVIVKACLQRGSEVVFDAISPSRQRRRVRAEAVLRMDGMLVDRIAISQNLALDGCELAPRARRGRRKKRPHAEDMVDYTE